MVEYKTKLRAGRLKIPVNIMDTGARLELKFGFNRQLLEEVKCMSGAKWHGHDDDNPRKIWSIPKNRRNLFQLDYLEGKNPYSPYDAQLVAFDPTRKSIYNHQYGMSQHVLTRRMCIVAGEMGTGKTLALIEAMERSGTNDWWWVAPKAASRAVELEFWKWQSKVTPKFLTYEGLVKVLQSWETGTKPPRGVVFDESSRIKNWTAQRTQAAFHLAEAIRNEYPLNGYVVLMSGSPAPKSPVDWWAQCEIACPGFLREGDRFKFQNRLAITRAQESVTGGKFNQLIAWKDNDQRCLHCGEMVDGEWHVEKGDDILEEADTPYHVFEQAANEVQKLYERMNGLVHIVFKKDCLDLPEKQYRVIECKPNPEIIRAAQLITVSARSAVQGMTLMRELSDGFQYREVVTSTEDCACKALSPEQKAKEPDCPRCFGAGVIKHVQREAIQVPCPKDDALLELLEEQEDIGRVVIYAGFTASIDRIVKLISRHGWEWVRVDGRGWTNSMGVVGDTEMLKLFQSNDERRIAWVAHPASSGMGVTLTASDAIVYYSNDFNAESRIQSEDRIHRPGCKGANIIDIVHLPSDQLVIDNLKRKRDLQAMTLGEMKVFMDGAVNGDRAT